MSKYSTLASKLTTSCHGGERRLFSTRNRRGWSRATTAPKTTRKLPRGPAFLAGAGALYFCFLDEAPLTNRKRWLPTTPNFEQRAAEREYKKLSKEFQRSLLPANHPVAQRVQRVGSRVAQAARELAQEHGIKLSDNPYQYNVVRSPHVNASVLANNQVFVFEGILKHCADDDDLAVVLAHELAHNVARHAGEKLSVSYIHNIFAPLLVVSDPSQTLHNAILDPKGHSRVQETEADCIGLHLAARACYDPSASLRVFSNLMKLETYDRVKPEYLRSHPSHDNRMENLEEWLPEARAIFETRCQEDEECQKLRTQLQVARAQRQLRDEWKRVTMDKRRGGY